MFRAYEAINFCLIAEKSSRANGAWLKTWRILPLMIGFYLPQVKPIKFFNVNLNYILEVTKRKYEVKESNTKFFYF